jgi:hypothetical protein
VLIQFEFAYVRAAWTAVDDPNRRGDQNEQTLSVATEGVCSCRGSRLWRCGGGSRDHPPCALILTSLLRQPLDSEGLQQKTGQCLDEPLGARPGWAIEILRIENES